MNPAQATDEELKQELFDRGKTTTGTREQMINRLTKPDNSVYFIFCFNGLLDNVVFSYFISG